MPEKPYRVLYVGGSPLDQQAIQGVLTQAGRGHICERAADLNAFKDALRCGSWDAAVVDSHAPETPLPAALSVLSKTPNPIAGIAVSDASDADTAARLLKAGAAYSVPRSDLRQLLSILRKETAGLRSSRDPQGKDPAFLRQGFYDGLTGLPARALCLEQLMLMLDHAARHTQKIAVFFIDLDKFKHVNDTYGHERGDWLLQSAAKRLSNDITDADILARLGGDEFLLVARIASLEDSAAIAHRLVKALEPPFTFNDLHLEVSASIGISIFPDHGLDPTVLMHRADQALYRAKHQGRNTYQFFSTTIDTLARKTEVVESSLQRALQNQEFSVLYQPQQCLRNGGIAGVEALARWEIPGVGLLPPEKFLAVAEDTGLIVEIEKAIWKLVFTHIQSWREKAGRDVPVTLNVSPRHFAQSHIVELFTTLLNDAALDPRVLTLQIGMSALIQSEIPILPTLRRLKELGIHLMLNGIGQPYFDLFKLRTLPLHALTIDRALVWELTHDAAAAVTVQWLIRLAHHLGLEAVAKGVETPQQLALLKEYGCDRIQGFVYSPPVSHDELLNQWLSTIKAGKP